MSEMKIILENWKAFLQEQEDPFRTIGDLRQVLKRIKASKKGGQAIDTAKDIAAGALLDAIPGAATVKSLFDLVKPLYSLPDERRTNTALDRLDVDDEVSAIVADEIEDNFLLDVEKVIDKYPDETEISKIDMTKALSNYISKNYDSRTVAMPSEK